MSDGKPDLTLTRCRVLVVEDEYFLADDLAKALRSRGAQVVGPIAELAEALSQVRQDGFDFAVIDVNLRDEKAFPIADELARQGIPFAFATGYGSDVIPEQYQNIRRWEKPYDLQEIAGEAISICRRSNLLP
jgi:ActR/RegA family two-component response regulator